MAQTTFSGPVRSENGFQSITTNGTTGAVTVNATYGANAAMVNLATTGTVIMANLPTSNPLVAGQLWNNAGVLSVSAG